MCHGQLVRLFVYLRSAALIQSNFPCPSQSLLEEDPTDCTSEHDCLSMLFFPYISGSFEIVMNFLTFVPMIVVPEFLEVLLCYTCSICSIYTCQGHGHSQSPPGHCAGTAGGQSTPHGRRLAPDRGPSECRGAPQCNVTQRLGRAWKG